MACECSVCKYSRVVEHQLEQLAPEQREFFEEMYDILINVEFDRDYSDAVIDGSWPGADEVIAKRRAMRKIRDERAE
jgi:hypothetical protein